MKTNSAFQTSEAIANEIAADFFKNLNYIKTTDPFDTVDFFITVKGNK